MNFSGVAIHGFGVRFLIRAGAVQVAEVAASTIGEAENYVGVQDPLPRRFVPIRCGQDHFR